MRLCIAFMVVALSACTVVPQPPAPDPAPAAQHFAEPPPPAAPKTKVRKGRKETRKEQIRAVSRGEVPNCGLVRWAASTFSEDRIKRLERSASAEQKRAAKACLG